MSLTLHPPRPGRYKYYHLRGTVRGIPVNESTGTANKALAQSVKTRREKELDEVAVFGTQAGNHPFSEAVTGYLEELERGRKIGAKTREVLLGRQRRDGTYSPCLLSDFGSMQCRAIDQNAIDQVIRRRFKHVSAATIQRSLLTPLSAVLTWAARRGWCERPWLRREPNPKPRERWVDQQTAALLVRFASRHVRPILHCLALSGARGGELLKLDWQDVDLAARWMVFRNTKRRTKGQAQGEDRGVPIHRQLIPVFEALHQQTGGEGRVFRTHSGAPYDLDARHGRNGGGGYFWHAWQRALRGAAGAGADVEGLHLHDLRHTTATWLTSADVSERLIDEIMGHGSSRMGRRYAHVPREDALRAIDRLPGLPLAEIGAVSVQWPDAGKKIA